MGDPKFTKKKYSAPPHPWQKIRIDEEKELVREYGLKNKTEVWRMVAKAKNFGDQAKRLTAQDTEQSKKEEEQLLNKLYKLSLLSKGAGMDEVLGVTTRDILERRLQTLVFKKGLARSVKQARQFITHRHITIKGKVITAPSFIVSAEEEAQMAFIPKSALADEEHPERSIEQKMPVRKLKKEDEKEASKGKKAEEKKEEKPAEEKKEEPKAEEKKKEAPDKEEKPKKEEKAEEKPAKEEKKE